MISHDRADLSTPVVYTVGHSNHTAARFVELLRSAGITALADVRTSPRSRWHPQFDAAELKPTLHDAGIAYVFLGKELGGRPANPSLYTNGVADYERVADSMAFHRGLDRIVEGSENYTIALMCAEREPLDCHRTLLVARRLHEHGVTVRHIMADGSVEDHVTTEKRLLKATGYEHPDLFSPHGQDHLADAYRRRALEVAYAEGEGTAERAPEGAAS